MNFKNLQTAIFVLFFITLGFSQARTDFTAYGVTLSVANKNGSWSDFAAVKKTEVPVTIDFEKNRIIVYSELEQVYRIAEYFPEKENKTEYINFFSCLSNEGTFTEITLITSKTANFSKMFIKDKSRVLLYELKKLE